MYGAQYHAIVGCERRREDRRLEGKTNDDLEVKCELDKGCGCGCVCGCGEGEARGSARIGAEQEGYMTA